MGTETTPRTPRPYRRRGNLVLVPPPQGLSHLTLAALLTVEVLRDLGSRCTGAGRGALSNYLGYLADSFRSGTQDEQVQQARREFDDWCSFNLPRVPFPEPRGILAEDAVPKIGELLGLSRQGAAIAVVPPAQVPVAPLAAQQQAMIRLCRVFEGNPFTTLIWKDEPVWVCVQVGRWLEYSADGRRLAKLIADEWSEEFKEGTHYQVLQNGALAEFKELVRKAGEESDDDDGGPSDGPGEKLTRASRLLLLTELGFYKVCMKSGKPVGSRLMDFAAEMLREYRKTGAYVPAGQAPAQPIRPAHPQQPSSIPGPSPSFAAGPAPSFAPSSGDPWAPMVIEQLAGRDEVRLEELTSAVSEQLGVDDGWHAKMRITAILHAAGWTRRNRRVGGEVYKAWLAPWHSLAGPSAPYAPGKMARFIAQGYATQAQQLEQLGPYAQPQHYLQDPGPPPRPQRPAPVQLSAAEVDLNNRRYRAGLAQRVANRLYKDGAITREEWRARLDKAVAMGTGEEMPGAETKK